MRPYWRNYFERTDAVVWVVDSNDVDRIADCRQEFHSLLGEEVRLSSLTLDILALTLSNPLQRLAGASILVFANKQDIRGALSSEQIREVRSHPLSLLPVLILNSLYVSFLGWTTSSHMRGVYNLAVQLLARTYSKALIG